MALPKEMKQAYRSKARKLKLVGLLTFGVGCWFVVGRKGIGILLGLVQLVLIPFIIFGGFIPFLVIWMGSMLMTGYLARKDIVEGAIFERVEESQVYRTQQRLVGE